MTTQGRCGSTSLNTKVKCFDLNFKAMVEKEKGVNIKCLKFDGGGKYFSNEFKNT